jgi:hypothetical protein
MDKINKIPNLVENTCDCYVKVGDSYSYLEKFALRKLPITNDTVELSCGQIAKRLQQVIDVVNKLIEINNGVK